MATTRYTTFDDEIVSENRGGMLRDYVPDPLGSTVALLDNAQAQTDTFSYWPYGENRARTGTTPTPFQFVGTAGYYHDNSGKDYIRNRTLDPHRGEWLTQDPIGFNGGDVNLYRYSRNNPTNVIDPSGQFPSMGNYADPGAQPGNGFCQISITKTQIIYGKYCGPQQTPGRGKGLDPLDDCCSIHDACFKKNKCSVRQQFSPECVLCTFDLCQCALGASCTTKRTQDRFLCLLAKGITIDYACGLTSVVPPRDSAAKPPT